MAETEVSALEQRINSCQASCFTAIRLLLLSAKSSCLSFLQLKNTFHYTTINRKCGLPNKGLSRDKAPLNNDYVTGGGYPTRDVIFFFFNLFLFSTDISYIIYNNIIYRYKQTNNIPI